ncbi:MAG: hypothetical protein JWL88_572 [Parcubacteria group bacterium]|nr:hypothetical protein [Parcubacteria group bacterium]
MVKASEIKAYLNDVFQALGIKEPHRTYWSNLLSTPVFLIASFVLILGALFVVFPGLRSYIPFMQEANPQTPAVYPVDHNQPVVPTSTNPVRTSLSSTSQVPSKMYSSIVDNSPYATVVQGDNNNITPKSTPAILSIVKINKPSTQQLNGSYLTRFYLRLTGDSTTYFNDNFLGWSKAIFSSCTIYSDGGTGTVMGPSGQSSFHEIYIDCVSTQPLVAISSEMFVYDGIK